MHEKRGSRNFLSLSASILRCQICESRRGEGQICDGEDDGRSSTRNSSPIVTLITCTVHRQSFCSVAVNRCGQAGGDLGKVGLHQSSQTALVGKMYEGPNFYHQQRLPQR